VKFENEFDVDAPIDEVYAALLDVERVAPNVPGASVLEQVDENTYKAQIKVKVGPMSMTYKGDVEIADKDPASHSATLRVKMKESRGQGNATATVQMVLSGDAKRTTARIETDVELSGKVAAMGRGVIQDVSGKLVRTFAENLQKMLAGAPAAPAPVAAPAAESTSAAGPAASAPEPEPEPRPAPAPSPPPAAEPAEALDLGSLGGQVVLSQLKDPKKLGALVVLIALIALLIGRGRD
jgi:carbon monoxide dehydrogenase subunit G